MKRAQNKTRRILTLIDALAQLRMPFTLQDAKHYYLERAGSEMDVCDRTIQRDMELLLSMNFVTIYRKGQASPVGIATLYKMNLTQSIERAARGI